MTGWLDLRASARVPVLAALFILLAACGGGTDPTLAIDAELDGTADDAAGDADPDHRTDRADGAGTGASDRAADDGDADTDSGPDPGSGAGDRPADDGSDAAGSSDDPTAPDPAPSASDVDGELEVHYLDVGQGDATLLRHDEVAVLIDTGRWQASDVVAHLDARGVETLDLVVVTHPHADHIGQFDQVMDALTVDEVWWPGTETTSQTFDRALTALERSDAAYEEPRAGDTTTIGPLRIDVLNPPSGIGRSDIHDASLGLRVTFEDVGLLFTGDAEAATEARMVAQSTELLDADILQLGHHGSDTSTTSGFLDAVDPEVAIYSAGSGNSYRHPHASVLDRLDTAGVTTYGTDLHGSVVVTTDGSTFTVDTQADGDVTAPAPSSSEPDRSDAPEPAAKPTEPPTSPPSSGSCAAGQIDLNAAGSDELQQVIHIGPSRAADITSLRPFANVEAMERIDGIGPARLADIVAQGVACAG